MFKNFLLKTSYGIGGSLLMELGLALAQHAPTSEPIGWIWRSLIVGLGTGLVATGKRLAESGKN